MSQKMTDSQIPEVVSNFLANRFETYGLKLEPVLVKAAKYSYGWHIAAGKYFLVRAYNENETHKNQYCRINFKTDPTLVANMEAIIVFKNGGKKNDYWIFPREYVRNKTKKYKHKTININLKEIDRFKADFDSFLKKFSGSAVNKGATKPVEEPAKTEIINKEIEKIEEIKIYKYKGVEATVESGHIYIKTPDDKKIILMANIRCLENVNLEDLFFLLKNIL
jgi:hypothetical protein